MAKAHSSGSECRAILGALRERKRPITVATYGDLRRVLDLKMGVDTVRICTEVLRRTRRITVTPEVEGDRFTVRVA